ncbi:MULTISPECIES: inorganic phosphate transporter [Bacillus]|uniref:Phosphate transporter n=1 Tax=Bacillus paralicheniformis TaxID=1648923 RepID=A0ABY3FYL9_9BACI|nr:MULTISPECIES: inorganic phosphate transporter [Bacillus]ETB72336.1 sulfate permease [Bacillus sp. CPSM8]POO76936.1 inorganic phosphate transporter [Bacillus sp. MBGLi97]AJO18452.1 sulfate permease [Bacillus paralicheniformis]KFM91387.1 sulfate permease CysP [Bacillus paralicheniformis]KND05791.1 sulfate permease [Bacillus paralicheniformis]
MTITILAFIIALFFAMNIGASGAAASMGIAYGAGAVRKRQAALWISGIGVFLGAMIGGGEVVKTIGSGIIPTSILNVHIVVIILGASAISLFIANIAGIPLSTSEVTVGSIVGVGVAFQAVFTDKLLVIVMYWLIIPIAAFFLAFFIGQLLKKAEKRLRWLKQQKWARLLTALVILTGFLEAFSAGMNNVANSVGPLVGAGLLSVSSGTFLGGLFVAIGAICLGSRVIETNGKKITEFSLLQGSCVSGLGASLVIGASLFGIPVPQTQITTCSIIGIGLSEKGRAIFRKSVILKLMKVWVVSPVFSLVISYSLVKIFLDFDLYSVAVVLCVFLATLGSVSLMKHARQKQSDVRRNRDHVKSIVGGRGRKREPAAWRDFS